VSSALQDQTFAISSDATAVDPRRLTATSIKQFDSSLPATWDAHQASRDRVTAGAPSGRSRTYVQTAGEGLEAALFKNRGELKVLTGQVAMHLGRLERTALFGEIDRLLDLEHWEDESSKIDVGSFRTYLRFTIYARPGRIPSLGVGPSGSLLAAWRSARQSVHVEFLPADQSIALLKYESDRGPETNAWKGHVARLRGMIEGLTVARLLD
jgi:hypothetical protein